MALPCCGWNKCRWTTATILVAIVAVLWYLMYGCCDSKRFDPKNIAGKRVVICGASSGIGAELAYEYARLGARIVMGARREEKLRSVTDKCKELGAQSCDYVLVDYSSFDSSRNFYETSLKLLHGVDVLILNHVIFQIKYIHEITAINSSEVILKDLYVNFVSYAQMALWFYPNLQGTRGRMSVISSGFGIIPGAPGFSLYSTSKHAIHGFFETMDFETSALGQSNISMTMCILGPIDTESVVKRHLHDPAGHFMPVNRYPADEAARRIIAATEARQLQLFYPWWVYPVQIIHSLDLGIFYHVLSALA